MTHEEEARMEQLWKLEFGGVIFTTPDLVDYNWYLCKEICREDIKIYGDAEEFFRFYGRDFRSLNFDISTDRFADIDPYLAREIDKYMEERKSPKAIANSLSLGLISTVHPSIWIGSVS